MRNSPNRIVGVVFGAVYVLVGLLGFAYTGGVGFIATEGGLLLGIFAVNPLHNIAHLLIGAALLIAGLVSARAAKTVNIVVGATYPGELADVRAIAPDIPILVPGVGAQGGDAATAVEHGATHDGRGLMVSSSRAILYASDGADFADAARAEAERTAAAVRLRS